MEAERTVGLADYLAMFRRRRTLMASLALPVFAIVTMVVMVLPNIYRSSAVFRLRDSSSDQNRQHYVDKYVIGMTDYVFKLAKPADVARRMNGSNVHVDMITEKVLDPDSGHDKEINTGFTVSYEDRDPKVAYRIVSWLVDAFLKGSRQDALTAISSQMQFFATEADRTRVQIGELEGKVADFKKQNFEQLPDSAQNNLEVKNQTEQEQAAIEQEISTQQQNRIFLMQQLQTAQAANSNGANVAQLEDEYKRDKAIYDESHPDMIALRRQIEAAKLGNASNADGSLKSELDSDKAVLAEARLRYSEDHPDIRRLESNIKSLEARIAAGEKTDPGAITGETPVVVNLHTQIHATETQIASLEARRAELTRKKEDLQQRLSATPAVEKQYEALERDLGTARAQYQGLLNQRLDAEVKSAAIVAGTADMFVLVQPAGDPGGPVRPRRGGMIMLAALGALILACVGGTAAEVIDGTVRGSRDVVSILAVSPLAVIPEIRNAAQRRRRTLQFVTVACVAALALPAMYFCVRLAVQ